jgi:hypothetical protein
MKEQEETKEPTVEEAVALVEAAEHIGESESFSLVKFASKESLAKALASAENAFLYLDKMREFVMSRTKPNDFTNQSGNPYFGEAGCNRFMAPFKIYEKNVKAWTIDENGVKREMADKNIFEGQIRIIFFSGIIGSDLLGVEASFEGGSRLDDTFRSKDDILFYFQKAKANWRGRGFRKLLGMENLTWADLAKVNIKPEDVKSIDRVTTEKADSKDVKELWGKLLEACGGSVKVAEDTLQEFTAFKDYRGQRKAGSLSEKQFNIVKPKIEKLYAEKFPEKAKTQESKSAEEHPQPEQGAGTADVHADDKFLQSITAKRAQGVSDEDYAKAIKQYGGIDDEPLTIPIANRNKFLISLKGGK